MKKKLSFLKKPFLALSLATALAAPAYAADTIKVGILHSLSGTMAISETSLRDVLLFTFDEINKAGGVKVGDKSYMIEPVIVDGASNWPLFAEKAKQLLEEDKVAVVFGCWTSVSRKSVLPVFEKDNGLLFYPVQYEGEELSKNIFYTAEAVNQQATPAVDYLLEQGKKKFYLIGTDYVYPQTTNLILYKYLLLHGIKIENIGGGFRKDDTGKVISAGKYTPFGHTDYQQIVAEIKQFAASGDACVLNTINGDSNVPFFKEIAAAGLTACGLPGGFVQPRGRRTPRRSRPRTSSANSVAGLISCRSIRRRTKPSSRTGMPGSRPRNIPGVVKEKRAVDSPMVLSYNGVYLWKAAVEKAGSFDVDKVREALESGDISFNGPGGKTTMQKNHHTVTMFTSARPGRTASSKS